MNSECLQTKPGEIPQPEVSKEEMDYVYSHDFDIQFIRGDESIYWHPVGGKWTYDVHGEVVKSGLTPKDLAIFAEGYSRGLQKVSLK
jgi:hypothetical protein